MRHPAPRCATPSESVMVSGPGAIVSGVPLKTPLSDPHGAGPLMPMSWERAVGQSKREWARTARVAAVASVMWLLGSFCDARFARHRL